VQRLAKEHEVLADNADTIDGSNKAAVNTGRLLNAEKDQHAEEQHAQKLDTDNPVRPYQSRPPFSLNWSLRAFKGPQVPFGVKTL